MRVVSKSRPLARPTRLAFAVACVLTCLWAGEARAQVCGDSIVDVGEDCDLGASNGTPGSCCTISCMFEPVTTQCRASAGVCDLAESCTGTGSACPADAKSTAECRAAVGPCDLAEFCDGLSDVCPTDAKSTAECRAAAGSCDIAELCDGVVDT